MRRWSPPPITERAESRIAAPSARPSVDIGAPPRRSLGEKLAQIPTYSAAATSLADKAPDEDMLERRADEAAAKALSGDPPHPPRDAPRRALAADGSRSGGQPLAPVMRAFFEPRFGWDFSRVRVHSDAASASATAAVNAHAFAKGGSILFGAGRFDPGSRGGLHLLAHELAHVAQQSEIGERVQRQSKEGEQTGVSIPFAVKVTRVLSSAELLKELGLQYAAAAADPAVAKVRAATNWTWVGDPMVVTDADVRKGYIIVPVRDRNIQPSSPEEKKARDKFAASLPPGERAAIESEAYEEFWNKTQYKVGQKLGSGGDDKKMGKTLDTIRANLLRQREAIEALPPEIKAFIFDETATTVIPPEHYDDALRIAQKISELTPLELAEYKSRVTARTTDWSVYESAVDRYLAERKQRAEVTSERRTVETRLFNMDALYTRYRELMSLQKTSTMGAGASRIPGGGMVGGTGIGTLSTTNKMRAELNADLVTAGFPGGITDFEALLHRYEAAFEKETLALAKVMLDQCPYALEGGGTLQRHGQHGRTAPVGRAIGRARRLRRRRQDPRRACADADDAGRDGGSGLLGRQAQRGPGARIEQGEHRGEGPPANPAERFRSRAVRPHHLGGRAPSANARLHRRAPQGHRDDAQGARGQAVANLWP
ncbi:DUF4157 domain-containing protein [Sphingomonas sp. DG1-23]|uniref:eCIS core domain-containing protein n=1 Tax=Sphingomonas sp. DG1-23 TaxID=3068316 RepID=UPI00273D30AC|nr:DUF4157 domain-containing protein [Sphingomonas sp. DG1-23]MDP5277477.1 DUF4157 domain-containing protein [Sphingomonas sp. DG1-23]